MGFLTGMIMGQSMGNEKAIRAGGRADRAELRAEAELQDHLKTLDTLKSWKNYAVTLRASLDAARLGEADLIRELQKLDPTNPLSSEQGFRELTARYYKMIPFGPESEVAKRTIKEAGEC